MVQGAGLYVYLLSSNSMSLSIILLMIHPKNRANISLVHTKKIVSSEHLTGREFVLLATNCEVETKVLKNHKQLLNNVCSILPPSGRLPEFWLKFINN